MRFVGKWQNLDNVNYKGATVMKLVLSVGKIAGGTIDPNLMVNPSEQYFDDSLFFEVNEDDEDSVGNSVDELERNRRPSMMHTGHMYPILKGEKLRKLSYDNGAYN